MNRRQFLGAAVAAPYVAQRTVLGANDRVQVGFIGTGNRAQWLLRYEDFAPARITAIADCFKPRLAQFAKFHPDGEKWAKYDDYRAMLDKEKLDGIFVETTTHARVLTAIHVLQAGIDVYAEKPLTLTVDEGRVLERATRRYNRILQTGTQQRSIPINVYASEIVRSGKLGKIEKVIACNFIGPERWTSKEEEPMPEGLNWDQWCNQSELRPYHKQLHFSWSRWWDYDDGGLSWGVSGWGAHALDQVQDALGTSLTGPVEMWPEEPKSKGVVVFRYENGTLLELSEAPIKENHDQLGATFIGTKGRMKMIRGDFTVDPPELRRNAPDVIKEGPGENWAHIQNFIDCIKTRKKPNADVEIGHRSSTVCHMVNICRDLGRKLKWDPKAERFIDDDAANKLLTRPRRRGYELPAIS